jgi:hypothetical protein
MSPMDEVGTGGGADSGAGEEVAPQPIIADATGSGKGIIDHLVTDAVTGIKDQVKASLKDWAFFAGCLDEAIDELEAPVKVMKWIDSLKELAQKPELTDYDLGRGAVLLAKVKTAAVAEVFKSFAPNLLKYIPSFLGA